MPPPPPPPIILRRPPYVRVPRPLVSSPHTTDAMLRSALALGLYMDGNGVCWPSVATLAASVGCSVRTIQQGVRELVVFGYLSVEYHRRRANEYRWLVRADDQLLPGRLVDSALSTGALRMALQLARMMNADGMCWPSIAALSKRLDISPDSAKRRLAELVASGAIHRVHCYVAGRGGRRSNAYVWPHRVNNLVDKWVRGGFIRHQERVRAEAVILSLRPEVLGADSASYRESALGADSAPRTSNTKNPVSYWFPRTREEEAGPRAVSALGRDGTTTPPRRRAMAMRRNPPPVENPPRPRRGAPNPWQSLERLQGRIEAEGGPWSELALDVIDRVPDAEVNGLAGELLMILDGATWPGKPPTVAQVAQAIHEWQVLGGGGGCRHIRGCLRKVLEGDPAPTPRPSARNVDHRGKPLSSVQVYVRNAREQGIDLLAALAGRPQPIHTTHEVISND